MELEAQLASTLCGIDDRHSAGIVDHVANFGKILARTGFGIDRLNRDDGSVLSRKRLPQNL